ncbi:MAG: hypothetical protein KDD32_05205 [Bacteroidetes bacterium]|nr:hypothetical protein [Bacteroidota bacterium]
MRNLIIFLMFFPLINTMACDNCGGGGLGLDANILSANNGNAVGLLVEAQNYKTFIDGQKQKNYLFNYTINGSYQPHAKVQIKFYLPLFLQANRTAETHSFGLGDAVTLSTYTPIDKRKVEKEIQHRWSVSGGLKIPTGKYSNNTESITTAIPFGSKSWDFILGTSYAFKVKNYILSGNVMGKITTTNRYDFKYGNSFETAIQNSYKFDVKDGQLYPFVGVKFNWQANDISNNFYRIYTGGYLFSEVMGLQFNYYQYKLAFHTEIPFSQHLNNTDLVTGNTYTIQFTYQF